MNALRCINLSGGAFDIGLTHGRLLRSQIRSFLDDDLCRLNRILSRPTSLDELRETLRRHGEVIAHDIPDIYEEIRGLAAGAEIELDAALLLQLRREVVGYSRIPTGGDCTSLCLMDRTGGPILAQTIDLNGDLDDQMTIVEIAHQDSSRNVLVLTFTGLLGYLGMNGEGLAIGLNLVLGGTWGPGVPPYLAIRHLLDHCTDINDCLDRLTDLQLASSRSLTICDRERAITIELLDGRMELIREEPLVHTNHFLSQAFEVEDALNPFSRNSSIARLNACRDRLGELAKGSGPDDIMNIFCQAPILVKANGDYRRERTVGAVVMCPAEGRMYVRCGDPSQTMTQAFHIQTHEAKNDQSIGQGRRAHELVQHNSGSSI